jgi:hypothetical protein
VFVVYFITRARARRVELTIEMQTRLIDRFGAAPDLVEFLHSPAGRQFVAGVQSTPGAMLRERLLSGFTRSIVLTFLGLAFAGMAIVSDDDYGVPAAIIGSVGIGYLIATFVSYRLSSKFAPRELASSSDQV